MTIRLYPPLDIGIVFYNLEIYWPGLDEEGIVEWGEQAIAWIAVVDTYVTEVLTLVNELSDTFELEFTENLTESLGKKKKDFIDPFISGLIIGIPRGCLSLSLAVTAMKGTVISILAANIIADMIALSTGIGAIGVMAKKAIQQQILSALLAPVKETAVAELTQIATRIVEELILDPGVDQFQEWLESALSGLKSTDVAESGDRGTSRLAKSEVDIINCITRLGTATWKFQKDFEAAGAFEVNLDEDSVPGADRTVKIAIHEFWEWFKVEATVRGITCATILLDVLSDMLMSANETMDAADQKAADKCVELRKSLADIKPVGHASSDQGVPDFFAPVRASLGVGTADSDEGADDPLVTPVADTRPIGQARANPNDLSVLDTPVADTKGTGRADSAGGQTEVSVLDAQVERA